MQAPASKSNPVSAEELLVSRIGRVGAIRLNRPRALNSLTLPMVRRFAEALAAYKQVRDDITATAAVRTGAVGGSPEVHEKIDPETGRGAVSLFASAAGTYTYVTHAPTSHRCWNNPNVVSIARDNEGRAELTVKFERPGAGLVFFLPGK